MRQHQLVEFVIHRMVGDALEGVTDMQDDARQELAHDIADKVYSNAANLESVPETEWDWAVGQGAVGMTIRDLITDVIKTHYYKTALNEIDVILAAGGEVYAV